MNCLHNADLTEFNTFGVRSNAKRLWTLDSLEDLSEFITLYNESRNPLILGGGSNVLLTKDVEGDVFHVAIKGVTYENNDDTSVFVTAMAGENWHQLVEACLKKNLYGLENLALIPGTVGAAPIQNIGAYGVELKDRLVSVQAIDLEKGEFRTFNVDECAFGYRDSLFKRQLGRWLIVSITLRLSRQFEPVINYSPLNQLETNDLTAKDIFDTVVKTRQAKLPDPKRLGNGGSFFKNPVVDKSLAESLKQEFPDMPTYMVDDSNVKLAAGWLIDQLGLKGYREGDAGVHEHQALVLVNFKSASGEQINQLADTVLAKVKARFGIALEKEVRVI
ncbi:UDP-N-acetylmuramate dehydrogenase [Pleionea litopenaei]|uniref:UDP-N-acetylenolpyruvoylglucosamine reductase n=1 Tax=Pleionea litopenaei TaxID=3070815 RepID=A0AA51X8M9_9GAMM|nr:UDP-N-acetylmuramate dehydrogenase [Pleionea sp. HL-JVS1]WMS89109.1 UDP-N-acetylmuramate dehydrogenase [Pleionea sp. HL-JVS1]